MSIQRVLMPTMDALNRQATTQLETLYYPVFVLKAEISKLPKPTCGNPINKVK